MLKPYTKVEVIGEQWPADYEQRPRAITAGKLHYIATGSVRIFDGERPYIVNAGTLLWLPPGCLEGRKCLGTAVDRLTMYLRSGAWSPGNLADAEAIELCHRLDHHSETHGLPLPCDPSTRAAVVDEMRRLAELTAATTLPYHRCGLKAGAMRIIALLSADQQLHTAIEAARHTPGRQAAERIDAALYYLDQRTYIERPHLQVGDLARLCGYRPAQFHALFVAATGMTPQRYLTERRIALACDLLAHRPDRVIEVAHACGFNSQSRFYHAFVTVMGMPPGQWRRENRAQ